MQPAVSKHSDKSPCPCQCTLLVDKFPLTGKKESNMTNDKIVVMWICIQITTLVAPHLSKSTAILFAMSFGVGSAFILSGLV